MTEEIIYFPGVLSYFTGERGSGDYIEYADDQYGGRWSMYLCRAGHPPERLAVFESRETVEAFGAFLKREAERQGR